VWCASGDENEFNVLVAKPNGRDHFEDFGVNRKIILKWILRKVGGCGMY
jgi:hypothetical protein